MQLSQLHVQQFSKVLSIYWDLAVIDDLYKLFSSFKEFLFSRVGGCYVNSVLLRRRAVPRHLCYRSNHTLKRMS